MEAIYNLPVRDIEAFLLVFARVGAVLAFIPIFSSSQIPSTVRILLALSFSVAVFFGTNIKGVFVFNTLPELIFAIVKELAFGVTIGLVINIFFAGIQLGAQWIGFQIGFSMIQVLNPLAETSVSGLSIFYMYIMMLIFFALDMHHLLIGSMVLSFKYIPIYGFGLPNELVAYVSQSAATIFTIALSISAPTLAVVIVVNTGLAVITKNVPQMNVFFVGMPMLIVIGLFLIGASLSLFSIYMQEHIAEIFRDIDSMIKFLGKVR